MCRLTIEQSKHLTRAALAQRGHLLTLLARMHAAREALDAVAVDDWASAISKYDAALGAWELTFVDSTDLLRILVPDRFEPS